MIEVIVASIRPMEVHRLIWSLERQSVRPDLVTVVSNEITKLYTDLDARIISFSSALYPFGRLDVALRRDIGIWAARCDKIVFQDDDQVAPRKMVESVSEMLDHEDVVWGHHRYIDFRSVEMNDLLDASPELGTSREHGANQEHGFQSGYAGMFGAHRARLMEIGGFDLMFLGRHGNEDQNLARRLCGDRIFVHEPPFAWHPMTGTGWAITGPTNICSDHETGVVEMNGVKFLACTKCPYWSFADDNSALFSDSVIIPFEPSFVSITEEAF